MRDVDCEVCESRHRFLSVGNPKVEQVDTLEKMMHIKPAATLAGTVPGALFFEIKINLSFYHLNSKKIFFNVSLQ